MTRPQEREQRPMKEALNPENQPGGLTPILLADALDGLDFLPYLSPAEAAAAVDSQHALIVVVKTQDARHKRRVYFSMPSAEAAVERAHGRGQDAQIVLVRLAQAGVVAHV